MKRHTHDLMTEISLLMIGLPLVVLFTLTTSHSVRADPATLYAAPDVQGSGDCSSWTNACLLQTALANAVSGDEIWVKQGVHKPTTDPSDRAATFTLKNGVALYGGFDGIETSLSQRDWQVNPTVLSGDIDNNDLTNPSGVVTTTANIQGNNALHVVHGDVTNNTAVLDGFIITAGQANGTFTNENGGGIFNGYSSPTLMNVTFSGNSAGVGGGMYNGGTYKETTLINVTFAGNSASIGGGMYNGGCIPTLTDVTFSGNFATSNGGGMYNDGASPTLMDVTFSGNSAVGGGGMFNSSGGPTLTNVIFSDNFASSDGGGMFNVSASPTLTNVTFFGNSTTGSGGGMRNHWTNTNPIMTNVTFSGNSAVNGGGMFNSSGSRPMLINSIMWSDTPDEIYNDDINVTISYSDVQECGGSGTGWNSSCGTDIGGNIDADPLFVNAAGGDLHLQVTSTVIDAGDNTAVPAGVTTDLDGSQRFSDIATVPDTGNGTPPIVDMGAYELDTTQPIVSSITRLDPNPTSAANIHFSVTFSEAVTGVDMADFSLYTYGGLTGASITGVSGSSAVYTITVSTGTGDGMLWLDLPASASITDPASNPLAGLPFTGGEVYDVDKTAPTVVSITRLDPNPTNAANVNFSVTFTQDVTDVDAADFTVMVNGLTEASITGINPAAGPDMTYTVTVSTGSGSGTLWLDVPTSATIYDEADNQLKSAFTDGEVYDVDKTAPTVYSITRLDPNPTNAASARFTVTFSEAVTGVDMADFSIYTSDGVAGASIIGVSGSGTVYTVTVSTGIGGGILRLDVPTTVTITDTVGNPLSGLPYADGQAYTMLYDIFLPMISTTTP